MKNFKLVGTCKGCKRTKLFLRKHHTTIAGTPVIGRDFLCNRCRAELTTLIH